MKNENSYYGYRGDRVRAHTADNVNRRIDAMMKKNVEIYKAAGPEAIEGRLRELEKEWDIERMLETNASLLALAGLWLGNRVDRRWLALPAAVFSFLLLHAVEGWCPPLPVLRRLGIRTQREIEAEKFALKSIQKMETIESSAPSPYLPVGLT